MKKMIAEYEDKHFAKKSLKSVLFKKPETVLSHKNS